MLDQLIEQPKTFHERKLSSKMVPLEFWMIRRDQKSQLIDIKQNLERSNKFFFDFNSRRYDLKLIKPNISSHLISSREKEISMIENANIYLSIKSKDVHFFNDIKLLDSTTIPDSFILVKNHFLRKVSS